MAAQIALGILDHKELGAVDSEESVHLQIEAMKIAVRAANEHFADPKAMTVSPEELLEPGSIEKAAASIGEKASVLPPVKLPYSEDTVYLTTADRSGMMVSFIQSNFMAFVQVSSYLEQEFRCKIVDRVCSRSAHRMWSMVISALITQQYRDF